MTIRDFLLFVLAIPLSSCGYGERIKISHESVVQVNEDLIQMNSVEIYEYRQNRFLKVVPSTQNGNSKGVEINLTCLALVTDIKHQAVARGTQSSAQFGTFIVVDNPKKSHFINWQILDEDTPFSVLAKKANGLSFVYLNDNDVC